MDATEIAAVLTVSALAVGIYADALLVQANWQREAIKRGFALYDPISGKWRWREPTDTPTERTEIS